MRTSFFWDERCFWHGGGEYAFTLPAGGLVQPLPEGLPENPETKRRLRNLIEVTGLARELDMRSANPAGLDDLIRIHPRAYLNSFRTLSDAGGGELGLRAPFGRGGYDIAAVSAGLALEALLTVLQGNSANAYALCRPPGHHCLPDFPNGFCLLANIAIAIEAARNVGLAERFAVLDWDVHHGNGTEGIFLEDRDVLTISIHQERNYPLDTGSADVRGTGSAAGTNINIPLPPGAGHATYLEAMERLITPAIRGYGPDVIIVACGYDASAVDPLGRMMATAETFRKMTALTMALAGDLCGGRLVMVHEGGYNAVHVPFCAHAVLEQLSGSSVTAPDPLASTLDMRQPGPEYRAFLSARISELQSFFGL